MPELKVLVVLTTPPGVLNPDLPRGPALGFTLKLLYLAFSRPGGAGSTVSRLMLLPLPMLLLLFMLNMLRMREPARADRLASGGCMKGCGSLTMLLSPATPASLSASSATRTQAETMAVFGSQTLCITLS
jgi:hypothetical protein